METHVKPRYPGYKGGFANITLCSSCLRTALYYDQHPGEPCPDCGSKIIEYINDDVFKGRLSGKWHEGRGCWLAPGDVYSSEKQTQQVKPPHPNEEAVHIPLRTLKDDGGSGVQWFWPTFMFLAGIVFCAVLLKY